MPQSRPSLSTLILPRTPSFDALDLHRAIEASSRSSASSFSSSSASSSPENDFWSSRSRYLEHPPPPPPSPVCGLSSEGLEEFKWELERRSSESSASSQ